MNSKRKPYMLTNQNSTAFWLLDNLWMPLATSHHTQDNFSLREQVCGTGIGSPQTHMHPTDEGMYILEGHVTFQVGPAFLLEDSLFTVIATKEQTGGSYSLLHQQALKDSGPAPHSHEQDEALYVLEGELTLIAGQEQFTATAGSFVYIPEGTIHAFRIESAEAQLLNWYLPGGFEQVVQEGRVPAAAREFPKEPVKSRQRLFLFGRVGMTVAAIPDPFRNKPETGS